MGKRIMGSRLRRLDILGLHPVRDVRQQGMTLLRSRAFPARVTYLPWNLAGPPQRSEGRISQGPAGEVVPLRVEVLR